MAACAKKGVSATASGASTGISTTYTPVDGEGDSPVPNYGESWDNYQRKSGNVDMLDRAGAAALLQQRDARDNPALDADTLHRLHEAYGIDPLTDEWGDHIDDEGEEIVPINYGIYLHPNTSAQTRASVLEHDTTYATRSLLVQWVDLTETEYDTVLDDKFFTDMSTSDTFQYGEEEDMFDHAICNGTFSPQVQHRIYRYGSEYRNADLTMSLINNHRHVDREVVMRAAFDTDEHVRAAARRHPHWTAASEEEHAEAYLQYGPDH